jgi:hypothetical protein
MPDSAYWALFLFMLACAGKSACDYVDDNGHELERGLDVAPAAVELD